MQLLKPCNVPVTLFVFAMVLTDVMPDVPWWRECQVISCSPDCNGGYCDHHDPVYDYSEEDRML